MGLEIAEGGVPGVPVLATDIDGRLEGARMSAMRPYPGVGWSLTGERSFGRRKDFVQNVDFGRKNLCKM